MTLLDRDLGRVAFEAYGRARGRPFSWAHMPEDTKLAWEAVAVAVLLAEAERRRGERR